MPDETSVLDPVPNIIELSGGYKVEVVPLATRQFFRLLKVVTHGAGPALLQSLLQFQVPEPEPGETEEQAREKAEAAFGQSLAMIVLNAVPDAENEAIEFVQSMIKPLGIHEARGTRQLSKTEQAENRRLWEEHTEHIWNPKPEDTLDILVAVIEAEQGNLMALGKKLRQTVELFRKTGQLNGKAETPPTPSELALVSPGASPPPSTS